MKLFGEYNGYAPGHAEPRFSLDRLDVDKVNLYLPR